jgi:FAD/FMN-containing dehydrogenase
VNICIGLDDEAWARAKASLHDREVYRLGGVLSGEHGISWLKKAWRGVAGPALELMRGIKQVFDPAE